MIFQVETLFCLRTKASVRRIYAGTNETIKEVI